MNKELKTILIISGFFGFAIGTYDFLLPFYFDSINLSFKKMGWIFSISFAFIFILRIYIGYISDFIGRKIFYFFSILLGFLSHFLTPLLKNFGILTFLKTSREISLTTKENIQPVIVFEHGKKDFQNLISKITGIGFFLEGIGILSAGYFLIKFGIKNSIFISSLPLCFALIVFPFLYKEKFIPLMKEKNLSPKIVLGKISSRNLFLITLVGFLIQLGVFTSHNFILPLYFLKKFHINPFFISLILSLHRIILGFPMLMTGKIVKKFHKEIFSICLILEGFFISLTVFMPNFILASIIFLSHDLGCIFWSPIYNTYLQTFSREENRAKDTSTSLAYTSIGQSIGPLIAGYVLKFNLNLPFFLSGLIIIIAGFSVLVLPNLEVSGFIKYKK